ncbi:MAG: hypothetical protein V1921_08020 [Candidatus Altiarchaeota archaeon]
MVLSVIVISGLNYFTFQNDYLPFIVLTLAGLPNLKNLSKISLSKDDRQVLLGISIYGLIFLVYYATFATFLAGDIITHASFIRIILEGDSLRIPLLNSYLTDYPKGYHFFTSFFAGTVGIIDAIKFTSVVALTFTLLFIYLVAEKLEVYAKGAVLIAAVFIPHYFYIFWGGYTSQFAVLVTIVAIYSALTNNRSLLLVSLFSVFIIQPRIFLFLISFAIAYLLVERRLNFTVITLTALSIGVIYYSSRGGFYSPFFFSHLLLDKLYLVKLVVVFVPALFVVPGVFLSKNRLLWVWFVVSIPFLYFVDIVRAESGDPRRLLEIYYVLFSLISANVLKTKYKPFILIFLLLYGSSTMFYEFNKYGETFTISHDEVGEFTVAAAHVNSTVLLNLDQICEWFYPLTGMDVSYPRDVKNLDYDKDLYYKTKYFRDGNYVKSDSILCTSRYSLQGIETPFLPFPKIKNSYADILYNGSLIHIMEFHRWYGIDLPNVTNSWGINNDLLWIYTPDDTSSVKIYPIKSKNVLFEGDFYIVRQRPRHNVGFSIHGCDNTSYSISYVIGSESDEFNLFRSDEKLSSNIGGRTLKLDQWQSFKVNVSNGTISAYFNDELKLNSVIDKNFEICSVAILATRSEVRIQGIKLLADNVPLHNLSLV